MGRFGRWLSQCVDLGTEMGGPGRYPIGTLRMMFAQGGQASDLGNVLFHWPRLSTPAVTNLPIGFPRLVGAVQILGK